LQNNYSESRGVKKNLKKVKKIELVVVDGGDAMVANESGGWQLLQWLTVTIDVAMEKECNIERKDWLDCFRLKD